MYHARPFALIAMMSCTAGCKPLYASVNEACDDDVPGEKYGTADAIEAVSRMNCYRRFEQLNQGKIDEAAQGAAEAHVSYLVDNQAVTGTAQDFQQDPALPGYSGSDLLDRLQAEDFLFFEQSEVGLWEGLFVVFAEPGDSVDLLMHNPYMRDGLLQPSWQGAGYAQETYDLDDTEIGYFNIVYRFPSYARLDKPVVYPRHGQSGIPTGYTAGDEFDHKDLDFQQVGYPITITVGSTEDFGPDNNPYELQVAALIRTETGAIVPFVAGPVFNATAMLIPTKPLPPNTRIDVEAVVQWSCCKKDIVASFWTGDDFDPIADLPEIILPPPPEGWMNAGRGVQVPNARAAETATESVRAWPPTR